MASANGAQRALGQRIARGRHVGRARLDRLVRKPHVDPLGRDARVLRGGVEHRRVVEALLVGVRSPAQGPQQRQGAVGFAQPRADVGPAGVDRRRHPVTVSEPIGVPYCSRIRVRPAAIASGDSPISASGRDSSLSTIMQRSMSAAWP